MEDYELDTIAKKVPFRDNGSIDRRASESNNPTTSTSRISTRKVSIMDADTLSAVSYLIALVVFLCSVNIEGLPRLPYPFVGNIQDVIPGMMPDCWDNGLVMLIVLYGALYLRKMLLMIFKHVLGPGEARRYLRQNSDLSGNNNNISIQSQQAYADDSLSAANTNISSQRHLSPAVSRHPAKYILPAFLYHIIFGFWIGWASNMDAGYYPSDDEYLIAGFLIFLLGETMAYWVVFQYVTSGESSSFCHRLMSEASEVVPVAGIAIFSLTLPACAFAVMRLTLGILALCGSLDSRVF